MLLFPRSRSMLRSARALHARVLLVPRSRSVTYAPHSRYTLALHTHVFRTHDPHVRFTPIRIPRLRSTLVFRAHAPQCSTLTRVSPSRSTLTLHHSRAFCARCSTLTFHTRFAPHLRSTPLTRVPHSRCSTLAMLHTHAPYSRCSVGREGPRARAALERDGAVHQDAKPARRAARARDRPHARLGRLGRDQGGRALTGHGGVGVVGLGRAGSFATTTKHWFGDWVTARRPSPRALAAASPNKNKAHQTGTHEKKHAIQNQSRPCASVARVGARTGWRARAPRNEHKNSRSRCTAPTARSCARATRSSRRPRRRTTHLPRGGCSRSVFDD